MSTPQGVKLELGKTRVVEPTAQLDKQEGIADPNVKSTASDV